MVAGAIGGELAPREEHGGEVCMPLGPGCGPQSGGEAGPGSIRPPGRAGRGLVRWSRRVAMPTRLPVRPPACSPALPPAGNGRLLSLMRVNNDLLCDLAAVLEFDDSKVGLSAPFFTPSRGAGAPRHPVDGSHHAGLLHPLPATAWGPAGGHAACGPHATWIANLLPCCASLSLCP